MEIVELPCISSLLDAVSLSTLGLFFAWVFFLLPSFPSVDLMNRKSIKEKVLRISQNDVLPSRLNEHVLYFLCTSKQKEGTYSTTFLRDPVMGRPSMSGKFKPALPP